MNLTQNYGSETKMWQGGQTLFALRIKFRNFVLCVYAALLLNGCNSVFYYPDNIKYGDPALLEYQTDEKMIESEPGTHIKLIRFHAVGKRKGSVVHFHGNAQNMTAHLAFTYWIPEEGYDLYIFDYQGYGPSEGVPSREATIADGKAVLAEAFQNSDGLPVFVLGQSLGAAVAFTSSALSFPNKICGLIFESGFASYRLIARKKLADHWFSWPFQYPFSYFVTDEYSPLLYTSQLKIPALFMHGRLDPVVPYETGYPLYAAYEGPDKTWIEIPNGVHTPAFLRDESPYRKNAVEFFDSHAAACRGSGRTRDSRHPSQDRRGVIAASPLHAQPRSL